MVRRKEQSQSTVAIVGSLLFGFALQCAAFRCPSPVPSAPASSLFPLLLSLGTRGASVIHVFRGEEKRRLVVGQVLEGN